LSDLYRYEKKPIEYSVTQEPDCVEYIFPTNYNDPVHENEQVYLRVYSPSNRPLRGDILFLHGIGESNIRFLERFPKFFASKGYRASMVILPYHQKRKPVHMESGDPFYSAEPDLCVVRFHRAVKDVRRSADLIETLEGFHSDRLWLVGVSFGGMIGTLTMGLDQRFRKGALVITGGNWRWINFHCPYTHKVRAEYSNKGNAYGCDSEETCIRKFRPDPVGWVKREVRRVEDIFEKAPIPCYQYDPISFAPLIRSPVLFIRGVFDRVIPSQATDELLHLLPNPYVVRYPMGHTTSIVLTGLIARRIIRFFD